MKRTLPASIAVLASLLALTPQARGGDVYWDHDPATPGDWFEPTNWNPNGLPGTGDVVHLVNNGTATIGTGDISTGKVYVGDGTNSGSVSQTDGSLTSTGETVRGSFAQTGGTNTTLQNPDATSDFLLNGGALYQLGGTGQLTTYYALVGGTFSQSDGTHSNGTLSVSGTYELSGAGKLTCFYQYVGETLNGTFDQTGGTNTANHLYVGYYGMYSGSNGHYRLSGTGSLSAWGVELGSFKNATGEFTQEGGTSTVTVLKVGNYGKGVYNQSGGSLTVTDSMYLGYGTGSRGDYSLSGGTLNVTGSNGLTVGFVAPSAVVQTGGTCTLKNLMVNQQSTYDLSGTGELTCSSEGYGSGGTTPTGAAVFTQSGGTHTVTAMTLGGQSKSTGKYSISGGSFTIKDLAVGIMGTGIFEITDSAAIITATSLNFGGDGRLSAVPGSVVHMKGASWFGNNNSDPSDLADLANLKLIFEQQTGATKPFELAGMDYGRDMDGLVNNFALGGMELGDLTVLKLFDTINNSHRNGVGGSAEALYLESLTMLPGSTLDLNGKHLYVFDLDYQGGTILNGTLISLIPGDADNNFKIDGADLALWQQNYDPSGVHSATNTFAMGDWNNDGKIDGADLALWQQNYNPSGMGSGVPEPATLLLLGTGLLSLTAIARRRLMH